MRRLRSPAALVVLLIGWGIVLVASRLGAWETARPLVVVLVAVLGVLSVVVFMVRWGETQDSVVERDFHRARLAEEAERILEEEEKQEADRRDG